MSMMFNKRSILIVFICHLSLSFFVVLLVFLEWLLHVSKTETDLNVRLNIAVVLLDWIAGKMRNDAL